MIFVYCGEEEEVEEDKEEEEEKEENTAVVMQGITWFARQPLQVTGILTSNTLSGWKANACLGD